MKGTPTASRLIEVSPLLVKWKMNSWVWFMNRLLFIGLKCP